MDPIKAYVFSLSALAIRSLAPEREMAEYDHGPSIWGMEAIGYGLGCR